MGLNLSALLLALCFAGLAAATGYLLWLHRRDRGVWRSIWHCPNGCGPTTPEVVEQFVCRKGHRFTKKSDWLEAI